MIIRNISVPSMILSRFISHLLVTICHPHRFIYWTERSILETEYLIFFAKQINENSFACHLLCLP